MLAQQAAFQDLPLPMRAAVVAVLAQLKHPQVLVVQVAAALDQVARPFLQPELQILAAGEVVVVTRLAATAALLAVQAQ